MLQQWTRREQDVLQSKLLLRPGGLLWCGHDVPEPQTFKAGAWTWTGLEIKPMLMGLLPGTWEPWSRFLVYGLVALFFSPPSSAGSEGGTKLLIAAGQIDNPCISRGHI